MHLGKEETAINTKQFTFEWEGQTEILPQRLEMWAEQRPDAEFFYYGEEDKHLTYREFNSIANQIANNLIAHGVQKGDRVCLLLTNPYVTIVSMFAIWKCGGVYAPINFNYAARQVAFQIGDTKPQFLITDVGFIPLLNDIAEQIKELKIFMYHPEPGDHDYKEEAAKNQAKFKTIDYNSLLTGNSENPGVELFVYDICNIIYTSGTTGLPKGVIHSYRWINNYTVNRRLPMTQEDVLYTDLPMYHIAGSLSDVGCACWVGCKVAVWDKFNLNDYWHRIRKSGATMALLIDVIAPWLLSAPESPDDKNHSLHIVNSQPLLQTHRQIAQRFGIDFITTGYASTESGNPTSLHIDEEIGDVKPPEWRKGRSREEILQVLAEHGRKVVSGKDPKLNMYIGEAPGFQELRIVDEHGMEVPDGQVGQLLVRPTLEHWIMEEYFGRPEATAEAFRGCWFHTGDAVVKDPENGRFYFVDRMGSVIRRRGENISPIQIEEAANSLPGVSMSAAFPVPAEVGGEDEVALVVVPVEDGSLVEEEFRTELGKLLPRFMVPKYLEIRTEIPRTATNKVEKYKLRDEFIEKYGLKK